MAQPAPAHKGEAASVNININYVIGSGYVPSPLNAAVDNNGQVYFICQQKCWVYTLYGTTPANVFVGETGDHIELNAGTSKAYTPIDKDRTITYYGLDPGANRPQADPAVVRGTIKVGSGGQGGG